MQTKFAPIVMALMLASVTAQMQAMHQKQITNPTPSYFGQAKDFVGSAAGKAKESWDNASTLQRFGAGVAVVAAGFTAHQLVTGKRKPSRKLGDAVKFRDEESKRKDDCKPSSNSGPALAPAAKETVVQKSLIAKTDKPSGDGDSKRDVAGISDEIARNQEAVAERQKELAKFGAGLASEIQRGQYTAQELASMRACGLQYQAKAVMKNAEAEVQRLNNQERHIRELLQPDDLAQERSDRSVFNADSARAAAQDAQSSGH